MWSIRRTLLYAAAAAATSLASLMLYDIDHCDIDIVWLQTSPRSFWPPSKPGMARACLGVTSSSLQVSERGHAHSHTLSVTMTSRLGEGSGLHDDSPLLRQVKCGLLCVTDTVDKLCVAPLSPLIRRCCCCCFAPLAALPPAASSGAAGDVSIEVMGGPTALGFCAGRIDDAGASCPHTASLLAAPTLLLLLLAVLVLSSAQRSNQSGPALILLDLHLLAVAAAVKAAKFAGSNHVLSSSTPQPVVDYTPNRPQPVSRLDVRHRRAC